MGKDYGPRKGFGQYIHTGDSIGIVIDPTKGDLSFALDGVNLGVAYEGIPLDKPLVPCVLLYNEGDSVELDTSEVKEIVDDSIPVPSNITANSTTWDSITITWDVIEGASFYQIEVDVSKSWDASRTNTFTKRGLLPDTDYTFRVRVVKGMTQKALEGCGFRIVRDTLMKLINEKNAALRRLYSFSKEMELAGLLRHYRKDISSVQESDDMEKINTLIRELML